MISDNFPISGSLITSFVMRCSIHSVQDWDKDVFCGTITQPTTITESWCTPFGTFFLHNICLKIACPFMQCLQLTLELIVFFCVHKFEFIYLVSYGWYCPLLSNTPYSSFLRKRVQNLQPSACKDIQMFLWLTPIYGIDTDFPFSIVI